MTEQEQIMIQIVGMDEKIPLDDLRRSIQHHHAQLARKGQPIKGPSHIQAIRHKKTGEVIVPSMYYSLAEQASETVWDSANDKMYTTDTLVYFENSQWISALKQWLKDTSRESFDNYELVVIIMKEGKRMPYKYGYIYLNDENGRRTSIYHAGIAGLPRCVYNDIKEIVVVKETFGKNGCELYHENKNALRPQKAYTPKEV